MRPSKDRYFIEMAKLVATRSTCFRRAVGCVLVNSRGHVLATGYNGVAAGVPHCNEEAVDYSVQPVEMVYPNACSGASAESGKSLDNCQAIHAEQNALLQCRNVYEIDTVYVTDSPCVTCTKLLLNTSARRIVFAEEYPHPQARGLWTKHLNDTSVRRFWEKHYDN